ncbi:MAG: archease [Thermodesulfobacteriota bacterium]
MPYTYLENIAVADAAFEAQGATREELFAAAAEATLREMIANPEGLQPRELRRILLGPDSLDLLLYHFLQELIFFKDSEQLLLVVREIRIRETAQGYLLEAEAAGETLDPQRHELAADVKAVTMHRFGVRQIAGGWQATVVLDI